MDKIIGIDVYIAMHNPRGMGIYTINFLNELAKIDKETKYILYADVEDENNVLPKQENIEFKVLPAKGLFHYEQLVLPEQCKKDGISILHSPANTSPIFLNKNIKRIITLHDVIFLKKEIPFSKNKKQFVGRLYYIIMALFNTKKASKVLTDTEYSKNDIKETLHINADKIDVVPCGNEHFNINDASDIETLQKQYHIPNEYYFHLGGDTPSKNTQFLLDYFVSNTDKNIVVAGIINTGKSYLYKKYKKYKNIYFMPYISHNDLVGLYKYAKAFIFPSLYEGFGIPLLEAMKCDCPIICSKASCLPEVAGDAAIYFDPQNKKEISDKIKELSNDNDLRQGLIQKGQERLKLFSWAKTAEIVLETYKSITGE